MERHHGQWYVTLSYGIVDVHTNGHPPARRFGLLVNDPVDSVASVAADVVLDERGRFRLANLLVIPAGQRHVDAGLWRAVPVAKIETLLNDPEHRESRLRTSPVVVEVWNDLDWSYERMEHGGARGHPSRRRKRKPSLALEVPRGGQRYPDGFYRKVAAAYTRLAHEGEPPATVLAERNDVPKTTAVRWIREARRRGFLAPSGGKGRIG
jgi:hypothetical protein